MRILSVDDSEPTRGFIRVAVELMGAEFIEAADGQEGMDILEREKGAIDLVLLDMNMPVLDGMGMLSRLKSDERFRNIPVTMVTTEIERAKVIAAIAAGARNYLMKPFTHEEVTGKILEAMGMGI